MAYGNGTFELLRDAIRCVSRARQHLSHVAIVVDSVEQFEKCSKKQNCSHILPLIERLLSLLLRKRQKLFEIDAKSSGTLRD